jgi:hypothetical protein
MIDAALGDVAGADWSDNPLTRLCGGLRPSAGRRVSPGAETQGAGSSMRKTVPSSPLLSSVREPP